MTPRRWWLLAVAAASLLCLVVLGLSVGIGIRFAIGAAILVAFLVFWALVFRPEDEGTPRALAVLVVTVAVAGALTCIDTSLAFFQAIAFPAAWTMLVTIRRSIIASGAIAAAEIVGFLVRLGITPYSLVIAIAIEIISFVFAVAMGVWISRIAELGNERKRLLDELTAAQGELELLHRDAGATGERERLARELHDTIAQTLTGLVLLAQRSRRELAAGGLGDDTLELIETSAREALVETRSLVAATAPVDLGGGIAEALRRLGERFERETRVRVTTTASIDGPVSRDSEVVLLRCAQEGLANVRKHSAARNARIELEVAGERATVRVIDDGRGFDAAGADRGFGLSGLRDRLGLVGGELTVDGTAGATTLTARVPLAGAPA
jgi:signal transduction histidine kinase